MAWHDLSAVAGADEESQAPHAGQRYQWNGRCFSVMSAGAGAPSALVWNTGHWGGEAIEYVDGR